MIQAIKRWIAAMKRPANAPATWVWNSAYGPVSTTIMTKAHIENTITMLRRLITDDRHRIRHLKGAAYLMAFSVIVDKHAWIAHFESELAYRFYNHKISSQKK